MPVNTSSHRHKKASLGKRLVTCPVCLDPILEPTDKTNGQQAIFCESICNSWLHRQCAGLSEVLFNKYAKSEGPFYCPHCRLIAQDSQLQELKTIVDGLAKEVISLKATVAADADHPNLPSKQCRQQDTQQQCQQQVTRQILTQDIQTPATVSAINGSTTMKKIDTHDEGDRKFNVVIHGIKECSKGTPRHERLRYDLNEVTKIVTSTEGSISPLSIRDQLRLGKYNEHSKQPRPVLVRFNRAIDRSLLLSKAGTLSGGIRIKPDLSLKDRSIQSLLLKERWRLIQQGMERKTIKIRSNTIHIANKIHGQVIDSTLILSQPQQSRVDMDTK